MFSIRGSVTTVPALRKWAGVSKDIFLNKTVVNPYKSLIYAMEDFDEINLLDSKNPYLSEEDFYTQFSKPLVSDYLKKKIPWSFNFQTETNFHCHHGKL